MARRAIARRSDDERKAIAVRSLVPKAVWDRGIELTSWRSRRRESIDASTRQAVWEASGRACRGQMVRMTVLAAIRWLIIEPAGRCAR